MSDSTARDVYVCDDENCGYCADTPTVAELYDMCASILKTELDPAVRVKIERRMRQYSEWLQPVLPS